MKPLSEFPKKIKTQHLELRVILPSQINAETILKIIEKNRDYLEAWQGHFEYLHSVTDVFNELSFRYDQIEKKEGILFGIYKDKDFIGRIRFFDINITNKTCKIGYWLIESENGKGFMSEALCALEMQLFKFGFDNIILEIDAGNRPSEKLAKRNGYILKKRIAMDSWAKCIGKCDTLVFVKSRERE